MEAERAWVHGFQAALEVAGIDPHGDEGRGLLADRLAELREVARV